MKKYILTIIFIAIIFTIVGFVLAWIYIAMPVGAVDLSPADKIVTGKRLIDIVKENDLIPTRGNFQISGTLETAGWICNKK